MIVWTLGYSPWIMGGDVNGPIGVDIEVGEKLDLGRGYFGYVVVSPITGLTHVAEAETGAFVGTDLETVRGDVKAAEERVMMQQIDMAREQRKRVRVLAPDEFWRRLASAKS
jgi:hypothetical protein